jgi:hypothetical protein
LQLDSCQKCDGHACEGGFLGFFCSFFLENNLHYYPTEEVCFWFYKTSFSHVTNFLKCNQMHTKLQRDSFSFLAHFTWSSHNNTTTFHEISCPIYFDIEWQLECSLLFHSRDYWSNHIKLNLMEWWTLSGKCSVYFWNVSLINIYTQIKIIFSLSLSSQCCFIQPQSTKCN